jgi:molybdopterin-guanine dinucleotide biosynthesis protein A
VSAAAPELAPVDPLDVTGVVLAGGDSRRMGRPKAWLPGPGGRPLVVTAFEALRAAGAREVLVAARDDAAPFARLAPALAVVLDRGHDLGPLAGLEAALRATTTDWVLVVACDMPHLDPALLRRIADAALSAPSGTLAVVPTVEGRAQPLHAAYHRDAVRLVAAALDARALRLMDLVRALDPLWLDLAPSASFANWNTPEDAGEAP